MMQHVNVILAVSDYWLAGSIAARGARIQDIVARGDSDILQLDHARLFDHKVSDTFFATLTDILVPKKRIAFIGMQDEPHEAPLKRFNNYQTKPTSNICLIVDGYCVEGIAYLPTKTRNVSQTLYADGGQFLAVTRASVQSPYGKRETFPLVLVNKHRAGLFGVPTTAGDTSREHAGLSQSSKPADSDNALLHLCEDLKNLVQEHDAMKQTNSARHLDVK
jgi:hypothetical protein